MLEKIKGLLYIKGYCRDYMSHNNLHTRSKDKETGFTIVEVMIVLAIAGLILAVVFVAVPALQRSQRNGARNNDIAYIKAQLNQLTANNGNRLPTTNAQVKNVLEEDELNYLGVDSGTFLVLASQSSVADQISWHSGTLANADKFDNTHDNGILLVPKHRCKDRNNNIVDPAVGTGTSSSDGVQAAVDPESRNIAILYTLEGDTNVYCEDTTL